MGEPRNQRVARVGHGIPLHRLGLFVTCLQGHALFSRHSRRPGRFFSLYRSWVEISGRSGDIYNYAPLFPGAHSFLQFFSRLVLPQ